MKLTGKDGVLRIYDGSKIIHGAAPLGSIVIDIVKFNGVDTWTNITTDVEADDLNYADNFIADNTYKVFIGSTSKFALVKFLKGGGANYAAGSGALIGKYFDGTDFDTVLTSLVDGTASGGDCFGQDGYIGFEIPRNWALGANALYANLDANKYYIELMTTTSSTTDVDADVLAPVDGQYFEVKFAKMDLSGPIGRPRQEEQLVLNRNRMDSYGHYVKGSDDKIFEPIELAFSCIIDDTYNKDYIMKALECDNPNTGTWTSAGTTTKEDTKNDGTNYNPPFADTNKKTVDIQILWTGSNPWGMAYYEVYFPLQEQGVAEAEEEITLSCRGGVYGVAERIYGFGLRY